uniref:NTP_transf_2 domain-containing protein n=1 Tax=Heterorhabditis bacteriophora TaxID=37862 RepID=A0A1I7XF56_HETBA
MKICCSIQLLTTKNQPSSRNDIFKTLDIAWKMCSFRLIPRQLHNTVSNVKNIQQQITFTSVKRKLELDNHSYPTPSVTREEDISYSFSDQILSTFPERINQFSENLCHDYNRENWATKKNASKSKNLIFHIRKALEDKNRTIIPIGSCVNGLAHRNSDLDLAAIFVTTFSN